MASKDSGLFMAFEVRELNSQGGQGGSSTVNLYLGELKEEEFKRLEKLVGEPGEDLIKKIEMVLWENFELKRQVADLEAKYPGPSFLEWKDQRFDDLQKKFDDLEASREETERGCEQALKDQQEATEVIDCQMREEALKRLQDNNKELDRKLRDLDQGIATEESKPSPKEKGLEALVKTLTEELEVLKVKRQEHEQEVDDCKNSCENFPKNELKKENYAKAQKEFDIVCQDCTKHEAKLESYIAELTTEKRKRERAVSDRPIPACRATAEPQMGPCPRHLWISRYAQSARSAGKRVQRSHEIYMLLATSTAH
ncbi:hypothetical protein F5882DRAFT_385649 [Hyaloscypha sp. PMI_1271]|nr:hypothetical protein F5882DRAFT_385649 [Hyaloscypha sp. PMI_1271]